MGKEDDHYLIDGSKEVGNTEILDQIGFNSIHLFNFKAQYAVIDEREETYHLYTSQSNLRTVKVKMPQNNKNSNNQVYHQRLPSHMPAHIHNDGMAHLVRYLAEQRQYKKELTPEQIWHPMDEFKNFSNELSFSSILDTKIKKYILVKIRHLGACLFEQRTKPEIEKFGIVGGYLKRKR
ncbi:hypothetical protein J4731_23205 [Providencia rettgeri]|nr:hypothetical protein [Providencia rettgeri]